MTGITLLGLGPGNPKYLTGEAREWLVNATEVYVLNESHPALQTVLDKLHLIHPGQAQDESGCQAVIERLLKLGARPEGATLAVTGHPGLDFSCSQEIVEHARNEGVPLRMIPGLSLNDLVIQIIGLPAHTQLSLVDAGMLGRKHVPTFPPSVPVIVSTLNTRELAIRIQEVLSRTYPEDHPVALVNAMADETNNLLRLPLGQLTQYQNWSEFTSLYISPMDVNSAFETFHEVVARLRAPDGCPWDREQTHASLRQHLLEESYETLEAIDLGSMDNLREELGDLLLQIVLNAQIASEAHHFTMADVINGINTKIINRHPHVFGEFKVDGVGGVLKNWEKLKEVERQQNGHAGKGLLDGAPASLPALAYAHEIQDRAARVGFDWPAIDGVIDKVHEELDEVLSADSDKEREKEIGDLAFAVVNLARWLKVDPESALRGTNMKFRKRFAHIETTAKEKGVPLGDLGFEEMDRLWEEAKEKE